MRKTGIKLFLIYFISLVFCFVFGIFWHETVGHGLVGSLLGGHLTAIDVLGVSVWPKVGWVGFSGINGFCVVDGFPTKTGESWCSLAGSISTWCGSVIAIVLLWMRHWPHPIRAILVGISLWWFDLLAYTSVSWGIPFYIMWVLKTSLPNLMKQPENLEYQAFCFNPLLLGPAFVFWLAW
ncbi:MAG: hypothetical protein WC975_04780 [Phycisphaerae bacterium]